MNDYDEILERHGPRVWRTAYRMLGNSHDADECLQEVFLAAWEYSLSHQVKHWAAFLHATLTHKALDHLRERARRQNVSNELSPDAPIPSREHTPEQHMIAAELADWLRWALTCLSTEDAEVFCLCCLEDFKHSEVAETLGMNVGTVGVRLHRARNRLRDMLNLVNTNSKRGDA